MYTKTNLLIYLLCIATVFAVNADQTEPVPELKVYNGGLNAPSIEVMAIGPAYWLFDSSIMTHTSNLHGRKSDYYFDNIGLRVGYTF